MAAGQGRRPDGDLFPEIVAGALPVIYLFIVNNPGEAAKRRIAAQTLGHLPPPLVDAGLTAVQAEIERLVDEFVQADGLTAAGATVWPG